MWTRYVSEIAVRVHRCRQATGLSNTALGTLTTLPLLAFGCMPLAASALSRRVGAEGAVGIALVLLTAGTALRAVPSIPALFIGTGLLGVRDRSDARV